MPQLVGGRIETLHLFPLEGTLLLPDIVVVEDEVEKLMWIALAFLHITGGRRIEASTAVLQATCVNATVIPYLEQRLNISYGCYGCRDATEIRPQEAVLGFPASFVAPPVDRLKYLRQKAIPTSRGEQCLCRSLSYRQLGASPALQHDERRWMND